MNILHFIRSERFALLVSCITVSAAGVACGIDKTAKQATAKNVLVATILSTPPIEVSPLALANGIAGSLGRDGGISLDGGVPFNPAAVDAGLRLDSQTAVTAYFGQRQGDLLSVTPVGIAGAEVSLVQTSGQSVSLTDTGSGNYALTNSTFQYQDDATYEVRVKNQGVAYVAEVKNVPALERVEAFHPPAGFVTLPANAPFTFTRAAAPNGKERTPAFVTVFAVDGLRKGATTYTTLPTKPIDLIKFVLSPQAFQMADVTVPAAAFPEANKNYIVMLQSAKLGGPQSDNLFTASTIVAGTADVAVVKTRAP